MVPTAVDAKASTGSPVAVRMALVIEYDGARYRGFQAQGASPTIQQEIERALRKLTGEAVRVTAAGRTDAGVHAWGQTVSFQTASALPGETFVSGLNHYLPRDIAVRDAQRVAESFDPRRNAVSREYRYTILNSDTRSPTREGFAHRVAGVLDVEAMNRACRSLLGEHDFASFASDVAGETRSTVRRIDQAGVTREGDLVVFDIAGNAFVRHQIRSIAGCLVRIGRGRMSRDEFERVIEAERPGLAGPVLPAKGLCLVRVSYSRTGDCPVRAEEETG